MKTASAPQPSELAAILRSGATGLHPRRKLYLALAAGVALLAIGYGCARRAKSAALAPTYNTATVARGDIALTITATGNLKPTNEVTVGSELSGTTLEVFVDTNDRVTKGQPLARLDTRKLEQQIRNNRAAVEAAKASVNQAEATLAETEAALARKQELQRLSAGKMPSQSDMDSAIATAARARATLASAKASVNQAEAVVAMNESDLSKAIIRSPIDGIVLTRSIEPGQTVAASFTAPELFVIAESLEQMKLEVAIAEADIGRVAADQPASFTVDAWAGRSYTAKVNKVSFGSATTNNVVTYETELEVSNSDLSLRPGMTATADIHVAESKGVLTVAAAALRYAPAAPSTEAPSKSFVQSLMPGPPRFGGNNRPPAEALPVGTGRIWVLDKGQPRPIDVKTGLSDGHRTAISGDGVTEGLAVITSSTTPAP